MVVCVCGRVGGEYLKRRKKIILSDLWYPPWSSSRRQGVFLRKRDTLFLLLVTSALPAFTMARWYHVSFGN